ncbi:hypothetical protein NC652_014749 [Populus alba x Populus x berolinensis]|nr:hypothetical protein NC652_014749 [Populus alba x Populus x berolinensis]
MKKHVIDLNSNKVEDMMSKIKLILVNYSSLCRWSRM